MYQRAYVQSLNKDNTVNVMFFRDSACGNCSSCGGCETKPVNIAIENKINARVGDIVELEYKASDMLKVTALLYVIPLIMLVLGVVLATIIQNSLFDKANELVSIACGFILTLISYLFIGHFDKKNRKEELVSIRKVEITHGQS